MLKQLMFIAGIAAAAFSQDTAQESPTFSICGHITGYKTGPTIFVSLYDNQESFATTRVTRGRHFESESLPADGIAYCFDGIAPGNYLIAAFQDLNGDRTLNTGLFGRPVEPYTFFRPFTGLFAPSFSACKFRVDGDIDSADLRF